MDLPSEFFSLSLSIIVSAAIAGLITIISVPVIVRLSVIKGFMAIPNGRTLHDSPVPNMGGVAIFPALIVPALLISRFYQDTGIQFVLAGLFIIFIIGVKDDFYPLVPYKKFTGQLAATLLIVIAGDIRVLEFHGLFGIDQAGYFLSVIVSILIILGLINSFNFIDGIDGLASGVGILITLFFGYWLIQAGDMNYLVIASALVSSLIIFFVYNVYGKKNKIFLGDSGSMMLGFLISVFAIRFNENTLPAVIWVPDSVPALAFSVLIIPVFDALRIITVRVFKGQSPFAADQNHIHHKLLQLCGSHITVTVIIMLANLFFIIFAIVLDSLGTPRLIIITVVLATGLSLLPELFMSRTNQNHK